MLASEHFSRHIYQLFMYIFLSDGTVKDSIKSVKEQVYKLQGALIELSSQLDIVKILKRYQQDIKKQ